MLRKYQHQHQQQWQKHQQKKYVYNSTQVNLSYSEFLCLFEDLFDERLYACLSCADVCIYWPFCIFKMMTRGIFMRNKYTDEKKKRNSVERQKHIGEKQRMFKCKKETCLSFFQYIFFLLFSVNWIVQKETKAENQEGLNSLQAQ